MLASTAKQDDIYAYAYVYMHTYIYIPSFLNFPSPEDRSPCLLFSFFYLFIIFTYLLVFVYDGSSLLQQKTKDFLLVVTSRVYPLVPVLRLLIVETSPVATHRL